MALDAIFKGEQSLFVVVEIVQVGVTALAITKLIGIGPVVGRLKRRAIGAVAANTIRGRQFRPVMTRKAVGVCPTRMGRR